jgi:hypothetical protein
LSSEKSTLDTDNAIRRCDRCGCQFIEQHAALCAVFGITNPRLISTGFLLYDPTQDVDVPDLDSCDRGDCPGRGASA